MRTTHIIHYRLGNSEGIFSAKINLTPVQSSQNNDAACGFLIGAGSSLDVWGASLIQQNIGQGVGLFPGISSSGELCIRNMETGKDLKTSKSNMDEDNCLIIEIRNNQIELICGNGTLSANDIENNRLSGNIALASHP